MTMGQNHSCLKICVTPRCSGYGVRSIRTCFTCYLVSQDILLKNQLSFCMERDTSKLCSFWANTAVSLFLLQPTHFNMLDSIICCVMYTIVLCLIYNIILRTTCITYNHLSNLDNPHHWRDVSGSNYDHITISTRENLNTNFSKNHALCSSSSSSIKNPQ